MEENDSDKYKEFVVEIRDYGKELYRKFKEDTQDNSFVLPLMATDTMFKFYQRMDSIINFRLASEVVVKNLDESRKNNFKISSNETIYWAFNDYVFTSIKEIANLVYQQADFLRKESPAHKEASGSFMSMYDALPLLYDLRIILNHYKVTDHSLKEIVEDITKYNNSEYESIRKFMSAYPRTNNPLVFPHNYSKITEQRKIIKFYKITDKELVKYISGSWGVEGFETKIKEITPESLLKEFGNNYSLSLKQIMYSFGPAESSHWSNTDEWITYLKFSDGIVIRIKMYPFFYSLTRILMFLLIRNKKAG